MRRYHCVALTAYLAFQYLDQRWCEPTVRKVQKQTLVLPMLPSAAQLQQGCLSGSLSGLVGDTPLNIKADRAWRVFQKLCAVIVNFQRCVCVDGVTLSANLTFEFLQCLQTAAGTC